MLTIDIPGFKVLRIEHVVLDFNGTLAVDGRMLWGVKGRLVRLARSLKLHIVTGDTFGTASAAVAGVPCTLVALPRTRQDRAKLAYVRKLGPARTLCIGNGRNDRLMLKAAAIGIAVLQEEGAASGALAAADLMMPDIAAALDALRSPLRLVASLRS